MEDQGRIDGAHNEAMGPVLIEGMVREMNHPRDPHDDGSSSFAGHDVGLRPGVGGPHEPDRAIRADVSDRHVLSLQLVAMQANDVEFPRRSLFQPIQHLRQAVVNPKIVFQNQGHVVGAFRDHPLSHAVAHPAADLPGREPQPPCGVRGSVDQRFVRRVEPASVDRRQPLPAEPKLAHAPLDALAALRVFVEVNHDDPH